MNRNLIPAGAVVVGVDGSPDSALAVDWAVRHARSEGRDLVLLHGVSAAATIVGSMASAGVDPTGYLRELEDAARAMVEANAERVRPALPDATVHTVVIREDARTVLIEASKHASVVVVGSRGLGPVRSLFLGSVGTAVAGHSHGPVVVVRPHDPGVVRRGVLVGADGTENSLDVLDFAFRQAAGLSVPLVVVHTVWDALAPVSDVHEMTYDDASYAAAAVALAETLADLAEKYQDVPVTTRIFRGTPAAGILALAESSDLVVVGHQRHDPVSRLLFGSVALGVLEHASSVVAVVPEP